MPNLVKSVVIVGGGFAGVTLAQRLERALPSEVEIVVLSAANHLVFTSLLPEVVGRTVSPFPVVAAGRQLTQRTKWLEAVVGGIDREKKEVHFLRSDGSSASVTYSHLVLACGAEANLDEIPGTAERAYPLKSVIPQKSGVILSTSSVHEIIAWSGCSAYTASKAAVSMMNKTLAQEAAPRGVRVLSVGPGAIQTPINQSVWNNPQSMQDLLEKIPLKRIGQPADIANMVVVLVSDVASYITGHTNGSMTDYPDFAHGG